jgi:endonuclease YncB( thermonuclease family)
MTTRSEWRLWLAATIVVAIIAGSATWVAENPASLWRPTPRPDVFVAVGHSQPAPDDFGGAFELPDNLAPSRTYGPCTVVKAVDGDTLELIIPVWDGVTIQRRVRVWGCDTPERRAATISEWRAAAEYTRQWASRRHDITVLHRGSDSLGRELCVVAGTDEGGQQSYLHVDLISAGHAKKRESR